MCSNYRRMNFEKKEKKRGYEWMNKRKEKKNVHQVRNMQVLIIVSDLVESKGSKLMLLISILFY